MSAVFYDDTQTVSHHVLTHFVNETDKYYLPICDQSHYSLFLANFDTMSCHL